MKNILIAASLTLLILLSIAFFSQSYVVRSIAEIASYFRHPTEHRLSDDELAKQVEASIINKFKEDGTNVGTINSFTLVNKSGNEYVGILKTSTRRGSTGAKGRNYTVNVIYDGKNTEWEIDLK